MPKKHLGQHFLTDPGLLRRIVDFADPSPSDTIVEIGPGRGALTRVLAERVQRVIAIEVDADLIPALRKTMPANVEVRDEDALVVDLAAVADRYLIVANLPYNISTLLLDRFVRARRHISSATVLLQKEVADRILAVPGTRAYGPLSVGIQHYSHPQAGFVVAPGAFRPPPRVDSKLLRLEWRQDVPDAPDFIRFVGSAFSARRKKLVNNLTAIFPDRSRTDLGTTLTACGLDIDIRPEKLTPEQFFELWTSLGR